MQNRSINMDDACRHVVGVSEMRLLNNPGSNIVTHSLGSCIGISIYDPAAMVGGILHFQLPMANGNSGCAGFNPFMYADTGIPAFFQAAYSLGAAKKRIIVKVAGGANVMDRENFFGIGQRNIITMKKIFWKNGVLIAAEDVGGSHWRTIYLEIGTGRVTIKNSAGTYEL